MFFVKELLDGYLIREIQLLMAATYEIGVTSLKQIIPYRRSNQSVVACYVYL
jgi:hypothetical protein